MCSLFSESLNCKFYWNTREYELGISRKTWRTYSTGRHGCAHVYNLRAETVSTRTVVGGKTLTRRERGKKREAGKRWKLERSDAKGRDQSKRGYSFDFPGNSCGRKRVCDKTSERRWVDFGYHIQKPTGSGRKEWLLPRAWVVTLFSGRLVSNRQKMPFRWRCGTFVRSTSRIYFQHLVMGIQLILVNGILQLSSVHWAESMS